MRGKRWTRQDRCPVCGGYDDPYRREGRCWGYLSFDGRYAYCTNVSCSGYSNYGDSEAAAHLLNGRCACGVDHRAKQAAPIEYEEAGPNVDVLDWGKPDERYDYMNPDGSYLLSVLRWNVPGGGKIIRQGVLAHDGWIKNLEKAGVKPPYPLYNAGCVGDHKLVFVVEGEKCADRLNQELFQSCGGMAVTSLGGSGGAHRSNWSPVYGKDVVILPDNDDTGRRYAESVAQCCLSSGASSVKVVDLPGLAEKGDIADWLDAGHDGTQLTQLIGRTPASPRLRVVDEVVDGTFTWEEPIPFDSYNLPPFPVEALPLVARRMVLEVARTTQTPVDLAALVYLGIVSTALGGKLTVWPWKAKKDEPLSLFILAVMEPATRKSPVFGFMSAPLDVWEDRETERLAGEISEGEAKKETLELNLKYAKDQASKCMPGDEKRSKLLENVGKIQRELDELEVPHARQVVADEATPEALVRLLYQNNGRMALLSEEGDALDIIAGRYSGGQARLSVYKKGYDGGTLRINRVGRAEIIKRPSLTICITAQYSVLRDLGGNKKMRGEGALDRFIFALPEDTRGRRENRQEPVPERVMADYEKLILALMDIDPPSVKDNPDGSIIRFSPDAFELLRDFEDEYIEPRLVNPEHFGRITGWAGKLVGKIARVAAILHCSELIGHHARPWEVPISVNTLKKAISIGMYFVEHAKVAFNVMEQEALLDDADKVMDYVLEHYSKEGRSTFTLRDVWYPFHGRYKTQEEFSPIVDLLVEYGYLRILSAEEVEDYYREKVKRGRRPEGMVEANPLWLEKALVRASKQSDTIDRFIDFEDDDEVEPAPAIEDGGLLTF